MKWFLAFAVIIALVAAACGGQPAAAPPPPLPAHVAAGQVYVQVASEHSFWVIDSRTGQVARTLPAGTPSPDWRRLYRVSDGALDVLDPATGLQVAAHAAPGWAEVVRTSADGRWLVFARSDRSDRFEVQDAAWASAPVDVALAGSFTFDGVSNDGRRLYLLERLGGDHYHVRMYDVVRGALAPYVIVDKVDGTLDMSGTGLASFATRSGMLQLTLYERSPAEGPAFLHVLPIGQEMQWAFCVDLPGPSTGWAFAPAPDGRHFYAANPAGGRVVELDGQNIGPPGMRVGPVRAGATADPALAVSPDGGTVYVGTGSGVIAVDAGTLTLRATGLTGHAVTSLAAGPDGALYAVSGSRLLRLDPRSLARTDETTLRAPVGAILHVA